MSTQLRNSHEMGASYANIVPFIKNDAMKEAAWEMYVAKVLGGVEAVKYDPATWLSVDEFWRD